MSEGREKGADCFQREFGRLILLGARKEIEFLVAVKAGEGLQCRGAKGCVPAPRSYTAGQRISSKDAVTWKPLCLSAGEIGSFGDLQGVQ